MYRAGVADGGADASGDRRTGPLGGRAGSSRPPRQAKGAAELLHQSVELRLGPLGAEWVVGPAGILDVVVEVADPLFIGASRLLVERGPGVATDVHATGQFK